MAFANGRPEAEVIVQFQDGLSYNKKRMESALANVVALKPPPSKEAAKCKKEDVDIIVDELEIPRSAAERALQANDNDLRKTLTALVTPPPPPATSSSSSVAVQS